MPASKKPPAKPVKISLTPQGYRYLEALARTGIHGASPSEVARQFVHLGVQQALRDGHVEKIRPPRKG